MWGDKQRVLRYFPKWPIEGWKLLLSPPFRPLPDDLSIMRSRGYEAKRSDTRYLANHKAEKFKAKAIVTLFSKTAVCKNEILAFGLRS